MTRTFQDERAARARAGLEALIAAATAVLVSPDNPATVEAVGALHDRVHTAGLHAARFERVNSAAWPMLQRAAEQVIRRRGADRTGWELVVDRLLEIAHADLRELKRGRAP